MGMKEGLLRVGFSQKEAKAYLSLLRLGAATASQLAEETGIERTLVYDVCAKLIEKGFASYAIQAGVKHFQAAPPEKIIEDLKGREKAVKEILPGLSALGKAAKEKTSVELYKGKEGMKTVFRMMGRGKGEYYFQGGAHEFCTLLPIETMRFLREMARHRRKGRCIVEEGFGESPEDLIGKNEEYRVCPKGHIGTTLVGWEDYVGYFVFEEPYYVILVRNKAVAERHMEFFGLLWKGSRKPTKKEREKVLLK